MSEVILDLQVATENTQGLPSEAHSSLGWKPYYRNFSLLVK
ncbi:metalloprotease [Proteus mirabilis]|uniref:Metalloprotease n=1 Tax=Proteus mirabilis TaxID=584 RepID=A0A379FHT6_PROMI|nr:metalloprotease [Proteus mirabilis]